MSKNAQTADRAVGAASEALFFDSGQIRLFGLWREPPAAPTRIWVFCPPFAEEEKSARRTLAEIGDVLRLRGDASLLFSYSGTGDSEGYFGKGSLELWRNDIRAACAHARGRFPGVPLGLIGLRLGATLALQVASSVNADHLVLMEPILQGRAVLASLNQKKRLRAMMTKAEGAMTSVHTTNESLSLIDAEDDFDGWPLTLAQRIELEKLDISTPPGFAGQCLVLQIGPRDTLLPAMESWPQALNAKAVALKMQPFWNLVDYSRAEPLFETIPNW